MNRFRVGAAVVCIIFLSSLFLFPFANADWVMFRSDPSHSGFGTGNPVLTPTLLWNYTTGNWVGSSPAVVDGVVYVGSLDGNVYALNAVNGAKLWNYLTGNLVGSSPAVVGGIVYIGAWDSSVYALGASPTSSPSHTLSNTLFIIIGVVVGVVIVAAVVFLMFQKRLKTKPTSPPPTPQNSASVSTVQIP
jgi:hypothetical protein